MTYNFLFGLQRWSQGCECYSTLPSVCKPNCSGTITLTYNIIHVPSSFACRQIGSLHSRVLMMFIMVSVGLVFARISLACWHDVDIPSRWKWVKVDWSHDPLTKVTPWMCGTPQLSRTGLRTGLRTDSQMPHAAAYPPLTKIDLTKWFDTWLHYAGVYFIYLFIFEHNKLKPCLVPQYKYLETCF